MSKIMYGYSGEGSGHSTRAREMAGALVDEGHDVRLASYDRGFDNLTREFDVCDSPVLVDSLRSGENPQREETECQRMENVFAAASQMSSSVTL